MIESIVIGVLLIVALSVAVVQIIAECVTGWWANK